MPKCSCSGSTCNCLILAGDATTVRGTGAAGDPYFIDVDPGQLNLGTVVAVSDSPTVNLAKTGTGGTGDPLILTANVRLYSPDNSVWHPAISNTGVLTWTKD